MNKYTFQRCLDYEDERMKETKIGTFSLSMENNVNDNIHLEIKLKKCNYTVYPIESKPDKYLHTLKGEIIVKNLDFYKNISVYYCGSDKKWYQSDCKYLKTENSNYEIWEFEIKTEIYKYPHDKFYEFAVKYNVNGVDYWENNNNRNFSPKDFIKK